ncbi:MAG: response regulator transcription factor [Bacteroidetes bacterium]|nr:response regulator transcription factor [Bacteroidota bacterium]
MNRILLIDGEANSRQAIRSVLDKSCPEVKIVGECKNMATGLAGIRSLMPDTVIMDIRIPDGSGFDLLELILDVDFNVLFITAHEEYALRAFKYHPLDYLLKPINPLELISAISRLQLLSGFHNLEKLPPTLSDRHRPLGGKITVCTHGTLNFIRLDQILYLQADSNYTTFFLRSGVRLVVSRPLCEFEQELPRDSFFRIHQSFLINMDAVEKVMNEDGGYAILESSIRIPIARRRKLSFLHALGL